MISLENGTPVWTSRPCSQSRFCLKGRHSSGQKLATHVLPGGQCHHQEAFIETCASLCKQTAHRRCQCAGLAGMPPPLSFHCHGGERAKAFGIRPLWIFNSSPGCSLQKEMATRSSILAWKIPWIEEPSEQQSRGSQKIWTWLSDLTTNRL